MNRSTLSLIGAAAALAAVTGIAAVTAPAQESGTTSAAQALPVERSTLLCPSPGDSDLATTAYGSYTPKSAGATAGGSAELRPSPTEVKDGKNAEEAPKTGKPVLTAKEAGKPVSGKAASAGTSLIGLGTGGLAPGWTVQQTTTVDAGAERALRGVACGAPDTDFWLPGVSTAKDRSDYVHLTNPDDAAAVVDIELYGAKGAEKSEVGEAIQVPPLSTVPVLLSTLTDSPQENLTAHVTARSGRIAAATLATAEGAGGDWIAPAADPAARLVLPGIPADATDVRLVAFAPGAQDADLKVQLAGKSSTITPAGHESLHVKSGMTASADLGAVTRGEPGTLVLTPSDETGATPVVAALQVTRGKGTKKETAFIPATAPIGSRATAAGNTAKNAKLTLSAPEANATVKVTASAGDKGGTAATKTYSLRKGTSQTVEAPAPSGLKGAYALTVEPASGSTGPVYAARELDAKEKGAPGVPLFTIQTLADDRGTVRVPRTEENLRVLEK